MIPLTVRSGYSFLWGVSGVQAVCRHARALGYDRLAMTDTDNLCGLWPFLHACENEGIRPIIGAEITDGKTPARAVCLAKDISGYENLCRLVTRRHSDDAFDLASGILDFSGGLAVLTTSPTLLYAGHDAGADIAAAMERHPLSMDHALRRAARRTRTPLVATPGSFFNHPADFAIHRVLRAIDKGTTIWRIRPGDMASPDAHLCSPEQYRARFAVCPGAVSNTHALAQRITFTRPDFGRVMPPWEAGPPELAAAHLRNAAYEGARRRYGEISETVVERLEHELTIIAQMGFCGYFLIVADIVQQSPRTCGRGSGAASLVAYCLGITNVCPVKHNLYFERFLNPGRKDPPDIDVDFAWDERDGVIASVLEKYAGRAAMVSNHVCFQPRMAVRETARAYGLAEGEISRVTKRLPGHWNTDDTDDAGEDFQKQVTALPRMREVDFPKPWPEILSVARKIIGLPRCLSVHPGGVVITPGPIDRFAPVQQAPKGVPILQWEKDAIEDAGLVKIDLLGNRSLGVIRDAVANMAANGITINESRWVPEDDYATQDTLARGGTMGCFYIESPAMRMLQQKTRVGDFEHLVIASSIIRPAANEVIQDYIHRLHGGEWEAIHPMADGVLAETFGLMVFQEDVSRVAVATAGFSHADADGLRKVMSKKDRSRHLADYCGRFADGARARGMDDASIEKIWKMIMSFNGYSFCKPHSASYAKISFEAAYLKTHFPAEFMAAVISNQGGFYSTFAYVSEAKRLGIDILPPDVEESDVHWKGCGRTMRVGFLSIKALSAATQQRIVWERKKSCFAGMSDFLCRVRPDEAEARALIHSGATDRFCPGKKHRAALLWQHSQWRSARRHAIGTLPLFAHKHPALPNLPDDNPPERLQKEFEVLGFLCQSHPMDLLAKTLDNEKFIKAANMHRHINRRVQFAGWLITGKTVASRKGDPMKFVTFEDETGIVETVFFPKAYHRFCHLLDCGRPFAIAGKVDQNWGAVSIAADAVQPLPHTWETRKE